MYFHDSISLDSSHKENISDQAAEKIKTHILLVCPTIFNPENSTVYEIMWKNTVKPDRRQMTI